MFSTSGGHKRLHPTISVFRRMFFPLYRQCSLYRITIYTSVDHMNRPEAICKCSYGVCGCGCGFGCGCGCGWGNSRKLAERISKQVEMECTALLNFKESTYLCMKINPFAPNDVYISRTAQLTSRRCILNIYSINILTEYFKHAAHSPFFFSRCRLFHNAIFWFL